MKKFNKPHLILNFDINGTMRVDDLANQKTTISALNQLLAENYPGIWDEKLTQDPMTYRAFLEKFVTHGKKPTQSQYEDFIPFLKQTNHALHYKVQFTYNKMKERLKDSPIFLSVILAIQYCQKENIPFTLILRSFGHDIEDTVQLLEKMTHITFVARKKFQEGVLIGSDSELTTTDAILESIKPGEHQAWQDDYRYWHNNKETYEYGKPFFIPKKGSNTLSLFFDDNVKKQIVCVKSSDMMIVDQKTIQDQLIEDHCLVPVDTMEAILNGSYFVFYILVALQIHKARAKLWHQATLPTNERLIEPRVILYDDYQDDNHFIPKFEPKALELIQGYRHLDLITYEGNEGLATRKKFANNNQGVLITSIKFLDELSAWINLQALDADFENHHDAKSLFSEILTLFAHHLSQQQGNGSEDYPLLWPSDRNKKIQNWTAAAFKLSNEKPPMHPEFALKLSAWAQTMHYYEKLNFRTLDHSLRVDLYQNILGALDYVSSLGLKDDPYFFTDRMPTYQYRSLQCKKDKGLYEEAIQEAKTYLLQHQGNDYHSAQLNNMLNELSLNLLSQLPGNALRYAKEGYELAIKSKNNILTYNALLGIMNAHFMAGDTHNALQVAKDIINNYEENKGCGIKEDGLKAAQNMIEKINANDRILQDQIFAELKKYGVFYNIEGGVHIYENKEENRVNILYPPDIKSPLFQMSAFLFYTNISRGLPSNKKLDWIKQENFSDKSILLNMSLTEVMEYVRLGYAKDKSKFTNIDNKNDSRFFQKLPADIHSDNSYCAPSGTEMKK